MKSLIQACLPFFSGFCLLGVSVVRADLVDKTVVPASPQGDYTLEVDTYTDKPSEIWIVWNNTRILLPDSGLRTPKCYISPTGHWILIESNLPHAQDVFLSQRSSKASASFADPYKDTGFADAIWAAFDKATGVPDTEGSSSRGDISFSSWPSKNVVRVALSNPMEANWTHPGGTYHSVKGYVIDCDLKNKTFTAPADCKDQNAKALTVVPDVKWNADHTAPAQ